jgi:eukaryotic-like serine/threonine-protein kinase
MQTLAPRAIPVNIARGPASISYPEEASVSPRAGQSVSHYRLIEPLGAGGMGVVWKAEDTTLNRVVAIKFLAENLARDAERLARFKREAMTVAALNHPNIVQIFSVDEAEGVPFLTMEYVGGGNLSAAIPKGGFPLEQLFEVAIPLADALHASHERNIVHRDLKPGNIMMGEDGRARIVDFGLAQLRAPGTADETGSTASGETHAVGTLPYMSPEQLQGKPVDARSDIFPLGEVLYQMATGERPFDAENNADLVAAIMRSEPIPVTRRNPSLPRQLERIIEHCMKKDRKRRFQTALDIRNELEDLRRELQSADPAKDGLSSPSVKPKTLDRNSVAVLPLRNLSGDRDLEYFSDGLTEDLISTLAQIRSLRVVSRTSAFTFKEQGLGVQAIGRRLGVGTVVEGGVQTVGRRIRVTVRLVETTQGYHLWAEKYDRELADVFQIQDEISHNVARALSVRLEANGMARSRHYTENLEAYRLYLKGRYHWHQETAEAFQQAFDYFQQALKAEPGYAPAHTGIADYFGMLGFWGIVKPSEAWPQAREAALRALELDPDLPEAHVSLGLVRLFFEWDGKEADHEFRRAIELYPGLAEGHYARALVLTQAGRTTEALECMRRARSLDPLSAILQSTEAWVHYYARDYPEAIAGCQRTLELSSSFLEARIGLGLTFKEVGRLDDALRELEKARELSEGNPLVLGVLGATLAQAGRKSEALAIVGELDGKEGGYVAPMAYAMLWSGLGDTKQALAHLRRALEAKDGLVRYLKVSPVFDGLRHDSEFFEILSTLNLDARA